MSAISTIKFTYTKYPVLYRASWTWYSPYRKYYKLHLSYCDVSLYIITNFVNSIILPRINRDNLTIYKEGNNLFSQGHGIIRALNGTQSWSSDWSKTIGLLTGRTDIPLLTMLPWSQILSPMGLLRSNRYWCPLCYEEWKINKQTIYDPLLWFIGAVKVCTHHKSYLEHICPNCRSGAPLPILSRYSRSGHCDNCNTWLGADRSLGQSTISNLDYDYWVADQVAALLKFSSQIYTSPLLSINTIEKFLTLVCDNYFYGNTRAMSKSLGLSWKTVRFTKNNDRKIQLGTWLQISNAIGVNLLDMLDIMNVEKIKISTSITEVLMVKQRRTKRYFDREGIQKNLLTEIEREYTDIPPPSMKEVAKRLDYHQSFLSRKFPDESKIISDRLRDYIKDRKANKIKAVYQEVRNNTILLYNQGIFPSREKVSATLTIWASFRAKEVMSAWLETMRVTL